MPTFSPLEAMPEEDGFAQPKRLILCANCLPVNLKRDRATGRWTTELDTESLFEDGPLFCALRELEGYEVFHVGVPKAFIPECDREEVEHLLAELHCYPVWCDPKRAHNHFQGYCKGILWPTFHNVIDLYSRAEPKIVLADEEETHEEEAEWRPARSWSPMEAEACWPDYCAMNALFARKVVEIYSHGDIIWTHDYHLLLLPSYLLRKLTNARIALFLHIPFPSSEIFRTLATREEILRAMLCADHIGFDLFEYARHFLTCCTRMLGLSYEAKRGGVVVVNNQGRDVSITCSHVGLNTAEVRRRLELPAVQTLAQRIGLGLMRADAAVNRGKPKDALTTARNGILGPSASQTNLQQANVGERRQMIVAVDEVEGLRGLGLKLLAFDRLFTDYAYLRNRVILKQIGLKLDSRPDDYQRCHNEVKGLVQRILEKWGPVIEYEEHTMVGLSDRLALFQNADVYLGTSVRTGVDMLPFEYLLARRNPAGCIVMSEFSACSRLLHGALRVNPFKTSALAATIEEALSMSLAERTARCSRDLETIERSPVLDWAARILHDVEVAHKDVSEPLTKYGGGFGTRVLTSFGPQLRKQIELDAVEFGEAFKSAKRRLILLDYSGTLVETSSLNMYMKRGGTARAWHYENGGSRRPGGCLETRDPISDGARSALIDLCRDPANTVVVISSDLRDELDHALRGIPNLALVAENGFVFREGPGSPWIPAIDNEPDAGGDWYGGNSSTEGMYNLETESVGSSSEGASVIEDEALAAHRDMQSWQELTMRVMRNYSSRTNGSFVWQSPSAVSFNYILADPELGALQSSNLSLELEQLLAVMPLTVDQGKGFVTVRLRGVNRGTAVRELLGYLNSRDPGEKSLDFVACFGDDNEDESSFHAVNKYRPNDENVKTFTVRVGSEGHTKARFRIPHPDDLIDLLGELVNASSAFKFRRNFSQGDFGDSNNVLGHFKTKQSYITLPQGDTSGDVDTAGAGDSRSGMSPRNPSVIGLSPGAQGMRHSPSYIASPTEMQELFGSPEGSDMPAPEPLVPPTRLPTAYDGDGDGNDDLFAGAADPRTIPPDAAEDAASDYDASNDSGASDSETAAADRGGGGAFRSSARNDSHSDLASPRSDDEDEDYGHCDYLGASNEARIRRHASTTTTGSATSTLDKQFHDAILDGALSSQRGDSGGRSRYNSGGSSGAGARSAWAQQRELQRSDRGIQGQNNRFDDEEDDHDHWGRDTLKLFLAALSGAGLTFMLLSPSRR